jgi:hypothetical protein
LVVKASEAATVNIRRSIERRPAAANAAADAGDEAESAARAAESDVIANAIDCHQDTLRTCYTVAAAAQAVPSTHQSGTDPFQQKSST